LLHAERLARDFSFEEGFLSPKSPFDFSKSLDFLRAFPPMQADQKIDELSLTRAVCTGGQTVVFNVRSTGLIKSPRLKYTLTSDRSLTPGVRDAVVDRIGFFLSLADDLEQFYRIGYGDVDFAPVLQRLYGLHQVKFLTPFESACWAVLSQRYPAAAAQRIKQTITEKFGTSLEMNGQKYVAFPEPYRLAYVKEADLEAVIRNQRKTQFLIGIAQAFVEKDEKFLRTAKYDEVEKWLSQIQGIGEWSSKLILLRGLGRMEKIAVEKRLLKAASKIYGRGRTMTQSVLDQMAEKYGPWKGYWAYYLRTAAMNS
jgi:DNA-3-methyladenine glycosylase II